MASAEQNKRTFQPVSSSQGPLTLLDIPMEFDRRVNPDAEPAGVLSTTTRRITAILKTKRINGPRDDSLARQCSLVGDSLNDEERCDNLFATMMRQDCGTRGD